MESKVGSRMVTCLRGTVVETLPYYRYLYVAHRAVAVLCTHNTDQGRSAAGVTGGNNDSALDDKVTATMHAIGARGCRRIL